MLSASPTEPARSKRLQSIGPTINEPEELGIWTLSSQTHTQLPEGRRREVAGTTSVIRLQRPFAIIRDFPKKSHVNAATLLKISETSNEIYDIIKHALAILVGSAAVRESCTLAEPPIGVFTDAKR